MEATIADGAIEVVRVSGDSREVRWRGVYEAKGRKWVVREAPEVRRSPIHGSTTRRRSSSAHAEVTSRAWDG